jgi:hypothetical protein
MEEEYFTKEKLFHDILKLTPLYTIGDVNEVLKALLKVFTI